MSGLVLHNFFRSSTSIRLRAALNLKGLNYDYVALHLRSNQHRSESYLRINPQGLVPALELEDGSILTQSLAVMEYLDETYPQAPLLPSEPKGRARVRALGQMIALEVHPLNNMRVLNYLGEQFGADPAQIATWFRHWVEVTFTPLEEMLKRDSETGKFCHGETPTLADICLYAQCLNNRRFDVDMVPYPTISRIFDACHAQPAFQAAGPEQQPDVE